MRKFLSLVLALVMMMSLITINTSAVEFNDGDDISSDAFRQAIDVISTIHVVDGYENGNFNPSGNLTRGAAAKIICNLILGPTTASQLHADTAPFRDVPVNHDFAGYIAYCQKEGIIGGYGDGTYRPAGTLTGNAFMKMLLGALGYDAEIEQYGGPNWSINVAKRAIGIGLDKGLGEAFDGTKFITREEACLYAFNTLQADLVQYENKITATVNGAEVAIGNSQAESRKWTSQMSRNNYIREDDIIQFAEEYFNKLEKKHSEDVFMRPAYTWIYDREEIGTYVDWEVMVEEYTTGMTGRNVYDLITSTVINDRTFSFAYYVDGVKWDDAPAEAIKYANASGDIDRYTELVRSNQEDLGITDNGVLTQVFLDKDRKEITITSINTWLAQATGDYQESKEYAPLDVYYDSTERTTAITAASDYKAETKGFNADVEDVPAVADLKDEEWRLVRISYKDNAQGNVVEMYEPETMDDTTVTKFSTSNTHVIDKLTTDGTEYKHALRAYYSDEALEDYDKTLLTDKSYNVFMDLYGYVIGLELNEGEKNYVFIASYNRPNSNNTVGTAEAIGILLDGTMQEMKVNVKATNDNITDLRTAKTEGWEYFVPWTTEGMPGLDGGSYRLNRWFTYSVNNNGVYTLTPAARMVARGYSAEATGYTESDNFADIKTDSITIKTGSVSLQDNVIDTTQYPYHPSSPASKVPGVTRGILNALYQDDGAKAYAGTRAYGNDASVYITVELGDSDGDGYQKHTIEDVTGVYTGVQDVEIEFEKTDTDILNSEEAEIYAVYDKNGYIIGAVTTGKVKGGNASIAYILSGIKSERIEDGTYYWEFDAVLNGEKQTLTGKSNFSNFVNPVVRESVGKDGHDFTYTGSQPFNKVDGLVELRMDSNGYVTNIRDVAESDIYSIYTNDDRVGPAILGPGSSTGLDSAKDSRDMSNYKAYRMNVLNGTFVSGYTWTDTTVSPNTTNYYDSAPDTLILDGRTLYITEDRTDGGLALASDAKAVVVQEENGSWKQTQFSSVKSAISHLADAQPNVPGFQYDGEVVAVLNGNGNAAWVVFTNYTELVTGNQNNGGTNYELIGITLGENDTSSTNDAQGNARSGIDVTLEGTNARERYTVELWNSDGASDTYMRKVTVTGTPDANGDSLYTELFINLPDGTYRVVCGDVAARITVS